jgi:hypothetical protein
MKALKICLFTFGLGVAAAASAGGGCAACQDACYAQYAHCLTQFSQGTCELIEAACLSKCTGC